MMERKSFAKFATKLRADNNAPTITMVCSSSGHGSRPWKEGMAILTDVDPIVIYCIFVTDLKAFLLS